MKNKYYNILLIIIVVLSALLLGVKYLKFEKYEELPEVKLIKNKENENRFAIMVQNENKDGYQEYDGEEWPKDGYEFNETETICIDNNGSIVEHAISFASETNTVTLETDKTIYCTLYFDKKEPLKITNVAVDTSVPYQVKLTVSATGGDGNYTYSVENSCLNQCNSVTTNCALSGNQVKITYNANIITIDGLNDCFKHIFTIKVIDEKNNTYTYKTSNISFERGGGAGIAPAPVCPACPE